MPSQIAKGNGQAKSKRQEEWSKWMKRWSESGLSQVAFCRESGLSIHSFRFWRKHLRKQSKALRAKKAPHFVPVAVKPEALGPLELELPGGRLLRIPPSCDRTLLADVLQILEKTRCS